MTDLRQAAQQALEALEALQGGCTDHDDGTVEAITVWCPEIIESLRAALAEPTVKESLQVESAFAENATTQQQLEEAPPSDYRRGYWDGFEIGKREGRIEAENALAEPQEPDSPERRCGGPGCDLKCCQPVQEPVAKCVDDICSEHLGRVEAFDHLPRGTLLYAILPQRKPLTDEEIDNICRQAHGGADPQEWSRNFARAVERAHKIGGEG